MDEPERQPSLPTWAKVLLVLLTVGGAGLMGLFVLGMVFLRPILASGNVTGGLFKLPTTEPLVIVEMRAYAGDAAGETELGRRYFLGRGGVVRDDRQALVWLKKGADQGDPRAENFMGLMCTDGRGVTRDDVAAVEWYRKAAAQNYPAGQANLARHLYLGLGVKKDQAAALDLFRKGAAQGDALAENYLGIMYERGSPSMPSDAAQALAWYQKSAAQGHSSGECNLGAAYLHGVGTSVDYKQALDWLQKAASHGSGRADHLLAEMYRKGQGVAVDVAAATAWDQKALGAGYSLPRTFNTNAPPQPANIYDKTAPSTQLDPTNAPSNAPPSR